MSSGVIGETLDRCRTLARAPTHTVTATVTKTRMEGNEKVVKTPAGAAAAGGGGEMGPDGRMFVLIGSLLILTAVAGLLSRRRTMFRG